MQRILFVTALPFAALVSSPANADDYPIKPVRIVAPFSAGGGTDVLARIIAQRLSARLGQSFIVENRPGAGGNIGTDFVAKATPDGYTLLLGGVPQAISASLYPKPRMPYDFAKDLAPVAAIASFPSMIVVHPSVPVKSMKELIALAKSRPGQLSYGSAGVGSPNHLAIELVKTMAGVDLVHIPYKSSGQVAIDLMAGQVQVASMGLPVGLPHVKSGKLKAVAVTTAARASEVPNLPTVGEAGLAGFDVSSWYGIFAPAATPKEVINKLAAEISTAPQSAEVANSLSGLGAKSETKVTDEFGRYVREEIAKWSRVVKDSGARAE